MEQLLRFDIERLWDVMKSPVVNIKLLQQAPNLASIFLELQFKCLLCKMYEKLLQHSRLYIISRVRLGDI